MKYYLKVLKNYATFSGRARRSEYWYFVLFNFLFAMATMLIDNVLATTIKFDSGYSYEILPYGYVYILYSFAVFIPGLAVLVRRLHDVGKSGWFLLICLIPLIGAIWILVLLFTDSSYGDNKYGPNPKGNGSTDEIDQIGSHLAQ